MKDLSFFLLKNSLAAKMKRGIRTFCNGVGSTSTLEQRRDASSCMAAPSLAGTSCPDEGIPFAPAAAGRPLTLEQMILQLDMEEAAARRARGGQRLDGRRMSCVNSSDILRSARNALSQYPRFSLDGRDAMYRSSFLDAGRKLKGVDVDPVMGEVVERGRGVLPGVVGGESVVWCKPGVVAKLMGLEALPVPVGGRRRRLVGSASAMGRKQSLRRMGRLELEKERLAMGGRGGHCGGVRKEPPVGSRPGAGGGDRGAVGSALARPDWRFSRAR